jgi:hypothetical protein
LNTDREAVYRLDRVMNMLDALQEYARRRNPASSMVERIDKMKARLVRMLSSPCSAIEVRIDRRVLLSGRRR